jgi:hypothetical protein
MTAIALTPYQRCVPMANGPEGGAAPSRQGKPVEIRH